MKVVDSPLVAILSPALYSQLVPRSRHEFPPIDQTFMTIGYSQNRSVAVITM